MDPVTTTFIVGGETFLVEPLTFYTIRRRMSDITLLGSQSGLQLDSTEVALRIVATALQCQGHEITAEELERKLKMTEVPGLFMSLTELFRSSGMEEKDGELAVGEVKTPEGSVT